MSFTELDDAVPDADSSSESGLARQCQRVVAWARGLSTVTKLCLAVIIFAWCVRSLAAITGWYIEDDFVFKYNAATEPLNFDYLFRSHYGNLMPGALAVEWFRVRLVSGDFWTAVLISGIAYTASSLLLLRLLRTWVVSGTVTVIAVAWFCFVLLSSETQFWWAATLNGGLMLPFAFGAVLMGSKYVRSGDRKHLIIGGILLIVALSMFEKAISIAVWALLAMWVWRTLRPEESPQLKRRAWEAAGTAVGICALYMALFVLVFSGGGMDTRLSPELIVTAIAATGRSVLTAVFGGPWSWSINEDGIANADPSIWMLLVAIEIAVLFVCLALWLRRHAWTLVASAVIAFLTSSFVLLAGRIANPLDSIGTDRAMAYRYSADLIAPLAVAAAVMFSAVIGEKQPWRSSAAWLRSKLPGSVQGRHVMAFVGVNLLLVSALVSWSGFVPAWASNRGGEWAASAAREINKLPTGAALINQPVPDSVIKSQVSLYSLSESILIPMVPADRWTTQSSTLTVVDGLGFVGPGYIDGQHVQGPTPDCGWRMDSGQSATVQLHLGLPERQYLIQVGYLSGASGEFTIQSGFRPESKIELERGLANVYTALEASGDTIVLTNRTDSTVCVADVWIGTGRLTTPPAF